MVESGMEDVGGRRLGQFQKEKSEEGFYFQKVFCGDEVVECSILKELEPKAKKMVGWEAVNKIVWRSDKTQRQRTAKLERMVESSEEQPADSKTASRKNKSRKTKERGSGS